MIGVFIDVQLKTGNVFPSIIPDANAEALELLQKKRLWNLIKREKKKNNLLIYI